jgi:hypothetical protein
MNRIEQQQRNRLLRVEQGLKARVERDALKASLAQTAQLAERRGEDVEQADGRLRVWSRDGLRALYDHGALDAAEYEAGLFFRVCYEAVDSWPTSDFDRIGSHRPPKDIAPWRAWRAKQLADMGGLARTSREATSLWRVAGEGRALRSLSRGGQDYSLNCRALSRVLGAIADKFGF